MARPIKFTPARQQAYFNAIEQGLTRTAAAADAGVSLELVRLYRESSLEFLGQEADAEARAEARFTRAAFPPDDLTKADARNWLERRRPDDWGKRENVRVSGDPEAPVTFDWHSAIGVPAPGSVGHPDPSGADQGPGDGETMGEDGAGGR